jgi:hypothetical protein
MTATIYNVKGCGLVALNIVQPSRCPLACNVHINCCRKLGNTVLSKALIAAVHESAFGPKQTS